MAFYVFKWSRGVLAMSAALAVLLAVLSIVASTGGLRRRERMAGEMAGVREMEF